ncbi:sigma-70 family RNA polymerase sigma factor [Solirubrobacter ginsenosidimutans]|uniref:Sigma-70 family RNA polymerase sigma factor n=1 Tax=Solirubrobacter ginsenosidimutans TaxID=490573 RepID=A0A9X3MT74_9ACTN|nr:sigma-70 family RNA polymerase sigma factor [Solirubrobacter ginsenosidimutans]MDA0162159.1 sigma-70 family RNA polymerase sigma factor [Solirubrobacter ginsenosidimutans]
MDYYRDVDVDAVADLYDSMSQSVLVFFARRTYDGEIALDLTAETFARALEARRRFRGADEREGAAWVWGIARNVLGEFFKRGRVERRALHRLGLEPPAVTCDEIERIEQLAGVEQLREAVATALAELAEDQREALRLRIVDELDYPVVAGRLGVTEATARARVSRGLRRLAVTLEGAAGA